MLLPTVRLAQAWTKFERQSVVVLHRSIAILAHMRASRMPHSLTAKEFPGQTFLYSTFKWSTLSEASCASSGLAIGLEYCQMAEPASDKATAGVTPVTWPHVYETLTSPGLPLLDASSSSVADGSCCCFSWLPLPGVVLPAVAGVCQCWACWLPPLDAGLSAVEGAGWLSLPCAGSGTTMCRACSMHNSACGASAVLPGPAWTSAAAVVDCVSSCPCVHETY